MPHRDLSEEQANLVIRSGFNTDNTPYEIFRGDPQKPLVRLGSLTSLERTIDLAHRLAARTPGDYIFQATTHELANTVSSTPQSTSARKDVVQGAELSNLRPADKT